MFPLIIGLVNSVTGHIFESLLKMWGLVSKVSIEKTVIC